MAALLLVGAGAFTYLPTHFANAETPDCDDNAVMHCGAYSIEEMRQKYHANQGGNLQAIFGHFGIHNDESFNAMVKGRVTGSNEVYVGDRRVATNAVTVGRQDIPPSQPILNGQAFMRPPGVSFVDPAGSLRAFVLLDENDRFVNAVIMSCGNPVTAEPDEPPAPTPPPEEPEQPPTPPPEPEKPQPEEPKKPKFSVSKDVRVPSNSIFWSDHVQVHPGDRVTFRIKVDNHGPSDLQNLYIRDSLPEGLTLRGDNVDMDGYPQDGQTFLSTGYDTDVLAAGNVRMVDLSVTAD